MAAKPLRAIKVIHVIWKLFDQAWIKLNIKVVANGTAGPSSGGGAFQNSRDFVKGCFWFPFGINWSYEGELLVAMHALILQTILNGNLYGLSVTLHMLFRCLSLVLFRFLGSIVLTS